MTQQAALNLLSACLCNQEMEETKVKYFLVTNKLREEILYEKKYLSNGRNYLVGFCLEHEFFGCG